MFAPAGWLARAPADSPLLELTAPEGACAAGGEGPWQVALAGCLYHRDEIDARIGACEDDAQRIARLLARGARSFEGVRGVFAFAARDRSSGRVVLGRDPLGIVPLFHAVRDGGWFASPSLPSLASAIRAAPDPVVIADMLADSWSSGTDMPLKGIKRVPPATILALDGQRSSSHCYWDPSRKPPEMDEEEVLHRFRALLEAAVARFTAMGRSGLFLSGGVDSISVAAMARRAVARQGAAPPIALSVFFRGSAIDEESIQTFVARELGFPLIGFGLDEAFHSGSALDDMLEMSRSWSMPIGSIWMPAYVRLAAAGSAAGCDVVLTGGGGDEWLGVSPYVSADLIRSLGFVRLARLIGNLRRSTDIPFATIVRQYLWTFGAKQLGVDARNRFLPPLGFDLDGSRARRSLPDWLVLDGGLGGDILARTAQARRDERIARSRSPSLYEYEMKRSLAHPVVLGELESKFEMGTRAGVRILEPYWDADVVELLYRTPPSILHRGNVLKGLVHRLLREVLPDLQLPRNNKLHAVKYFQDRLRVEARRAWDTFGGAAELDRMGIVDNAKLSRVVEAQFADSATNLWLVPHVLAIEAWVRGHR